MIPHLGIYLHAYGTGLNAMSGFPNVSPALSAATNSLGAALPPPLAPAGIYLHAYDTGLNVKNGFPVFSTVLEANQVKKREDAASMQSLSDEDKVAIHELAKDPRIGECGGATLVFSCWICWIIFP